MVWYDYLSIYLHQDLFDSINIIICNKLRGEVITILANDPVPFTRLTRYYVVGSTVLAVILIVRSGW